MKDTKITPEEYNEIIKCLDLKSINLIESSFKISNDDNIAGRVSLKINDKYSFEDREDVVIFHAYFKFVGTKEGSALAKKMQSFILSGKYSLTYSKNKEIKINDDFFEVFSEISLCMAAWPYIREYIQSTIVRSGLPPSPYQ